MCLPDGSARIWPSAIGHLQYFGRHLEVVCVTYSRGSIRAGLAAHPLYLAIQAEYLGEMRQFSDQIGPLLTNDSRGYPAGSETTAFTDNRPALVDDRSGKVEGKGANGRWIRAHGVGAVRTALTYVACA